MRSFVKRRFFVGGWQNRLLAASVLHFFLIAVVFALTLFVPLFAGLKSDSGYDPETTRTARDFMALHTRIWPPLLLAFALSLLHSILVSHRVAGPLYRLTREFDGIGRGDLSRPIRVRKDDYLQEEAAVIDTMVTRLRSRLMTIKDAHKSATTAMLEMEHAAEAGSRERFQNALRAAREDMSGMAAELDTFICSDDEAAAAGKPKEPIATLEVTREPEPVA